MGACLICRKLTKEQFNLDDEVEFGYCKKHEFIVHVYVTLLMSETKTNAAKWLENQRKNESKSKGNPGAAKTKRR
jgi:hypothetical protein